MRPLVASIHQPCKHVAEFLKVARPAECGECRTGRRCELAGHLSRVRYLLEHGVEEQRQVRSAVAKRRHVQAETLQPAVEFRTKSMLTNVDLQARIGGGDQSKPDRRGQFPDPQFAVPKHPRQANLHRGRHLTDAAEKHRAGPRQRQCAIAGHRLVVGAYRLVVAEEAGGERFDALAAIDGDERPRCPRTRLVDRARDAFRRKPGLRDD